MNGYNKHSRYSPPCNNPLSTWAEVQTKPHWRKVTHANDFLSQLPIYLTEELLWPQEHGQPIYMAKWKLVASEANFSQ